MQIDTMSAITKGYWKALKAGLADFGSKWIAFYWLFIVCTGPTVQSTYKALRLIQYKSYITGSANSLRLALSASVRACY